MLGGPGGLTSTHCAARVRRLALLSKRKSPYTLPANTQPSRIVYHTMHQAPKISLLTIGEELLLGLTPNGHLSFIGEQLRKVGLAMHANSTISDKPEDIALYFRRCWQDSDIVIATGGLGPTVDDRTKEVLAEALGQKLVFDLEIMQAIERRFQAMGRRPSQNNRKQAYRFEDSEVLENANGTAPGLWLKRGKKCLVMLPGPPHELQPIFTQQVLPRLKQMGLLDGAPRYVQIRTTGVGESALETLLAPLGKRDSELELAYCAHPGLVDVRLSLPAAEDREERLAALADQAKELLGANFLAEGEDTPVQILAQILADKRLTLAFAESCTGGHLANEITNLPGASAFFRGSAVTYAESAKESLIGVSRSSIQSFSAVSEAVAIEMAAGAAERFSADIALSTTGYLGPSGGTAQDPIGTVYLGIKTPSRCFSRRLSLRGPRSILKRRILNAALELLLKEARSLLCLPSKSRSRADACE